MDTAFGWAGAGQHEDVYLPRSVGQMMSWGRFELDDAFLGACFGQLLQCDGDVGSGDGAGGGARHVSSSYDAVGGSAGVASEPTGFLSSASDVLFASVVDGAGAHDGLLDTALTCGEGDGGAISNGAMFSGYSGTTGGNFSSGESNNYSCGGHDAEVGSPASTISPTTPSLPQMVSAHQSLHPKRKLPDDYPAIATAPPAPPLPRPDAKRNKQATNKATSITFGQGPDDGTAAGAAGGFEPDMEAMAQVKEMIYCAAAMRPVNLVTEAPADNNKPRRKNVRISSEPQTVAARLRRERVSDRLRVLQKLVPGGSKMDTASMLDEAASYLKFLKSQVQALETLGTTTSSSTARLEQHYYSNSSGFLGFSRNNNNISVFGNSNGNATKLL